MDGWKNKASWGIITILVTILTFMLGRYSVSGQLATVNSRLDKVETTVSLSLSNIDTSMKDIKTEIANINMRINELR